MVAFIFIGRTLTAAGVFWRAVFARFAATVPGFDKLKLAMPQTCGDRSSVRYLRRLTCHRLRDYSRFT